MKASKIKRKTKETEIMVNLTIEGKGNSKIKTGVKFLDHMLESFTKHGLFNVEINAKTLDKDQHHLVEDIGICLGKAFNEALGDKKGINRAGYFVIPMDESLAIMSIDIGGRPYLKFEAEFKGEKINDLKSELIQDFFEGFSRNLEANIHVILPYGRTDHHRAEAIFKAFAKALKMACSTDARAIGQIPSTKGVL